MSVFGSCGLAHLLLEPTSVFDQHEGASLVRVMFKREDVCGLKIFMYGMLLICLVTHVSKGREKGGGGGVSGPCGF